MFCLFSFKRLIVNNWMDRWELLRVDEAHSKNILLGGLHLTRFCLHQNLQFRFLDFVQIKFRDFRSIRLFFRWDEFDIAFIFAKSRFRVKVRDFLALLTLDFFLDWWQRIIESCREFLPSVRKPRLLWALPLFLCKSLNYADLFLHLNWVIVQLATSVAGTGPIWAVLVNLYCFVWTITGMLYCGSVGKLLEFFLLN